MTFGFPDLPEWEAGTLTHSATPTGWVRVLYRVRILFRYKVIDLLSLEIRVRVRVLLIQMV